MKPLLVIVGETASGKSALAMELARQFDGEIISADSWTVYRGFDIGTAKPSEADQREVPHHLLDITDAKDGFSAVLFKRLAEQVIEEIGARGKVPILVGGTGLYIDSVLYDYGFLAPADPERRDQLNDMTLPALLQLAKDLGLDTGTVDERNKRRVIRLIENMGAEPTRQPLRENTLVLGVRIPRDQLEARVTERVDGMLAAGLEDEVRELAGQYGWDVEPMKGIGYREWEPYVAGTQDLAQTRERIIRATLQLAKRQRTWFRRNNSIHWVNDRSKAVDITTTLLNN